MWLVWVVVQWVSQLDPILVLRGQLLLRAQLLVVRMPNSDRHLPDMLLVEEEEWEIWLEETVN